MYEVQHYTICDGWVNCWTDTDEAGVSIPTIFKTYAEALDALNELFEDDLEEYNRGNIDSMFEIDEFRIMEIDRW